MVNVKRQRARIKLRATEISHEILISIAKNLKYRESEDGIELLPIRETCSDERALEIACEGIEDEDCQCFYRLGIVGTPCYEHEDQRSYYAEAFSIKMQLEKGDYITKFGSRV